ncbi:hypothetical protein [Sphingomicrobium arenosum]|uniref:hypothetical protein n=1 Tax=Sphingomicrobium arenosum TaxID=2233861 RepID=UPI002240394B|nr:hypothetical protein [Sphingomicrobium arenosum]
MPLHRADPYLVSLAAALALAACGGGSGGSTPPPPVVDGPDPTPAPSPPPSLPPGDAAGIMFAGAEIGDAIQVRTACIEHATGLSATGVPTISQPWTSVDQNDFVDFAQGFGGMFLVWQGIDDYFSYIDWGAWSPVAPHNNDRKVVAGPPYDVLFEGTDHALSIPRRTSLVDVESATLGTIATTDTFCTWSGGLSFDEGLVPAGARYEGAADGLGWISGGAIRYYGSQMTYVGNGNAATISIAFVGRMPAFDDLAGEGVALETMIFDKPANSNVAVPRVGNYVTGGNLTLQPVSAGAGLAGDFALKLRGGDVLMGSIAADRIN